MRAIPTGDLAAVVADLAAVPLEQIPAALGELEKTKALLWARLLASAGEHRRPPADACATAEWMTPRDVRAWFKLSDRTIRRHMRDGTWRQGEHWFRHKGGRPRFRRSALEAWVRAQDQPVPPVGLAYGADIPQGRRRRLISLRNECTTARHGAATGAEAVGAAGRVPGASAAHGVARES